MNERIKKWKTWSEGTARKKGKKQLKKRGKKERKIRLRNEKQKKEKEREKGDTIKLQIFPERRDFQDRLPIRDKTEASTLDKNAHNGALK